MRGERLPLLAVASLLACTAGAANVSSSDLAQCAAIQAADARLACYDGLAHRAGVGTAAPAAAPVRTAPTASLPPSPSPAAGAPAAPTPSTSNAYVNDPKNFGLTPGQLEKDQPKASGVKSIKARISGLSSPLPGKSRIVLDNDMTWDVLDDDGLLNLGDEVTIRKASLGSYLMNAPSHHLYRVHRVR